MLMEESFGRKRWETAEGCEEGLHLLTSLLITLVIRCYWLICLHLL